MAQQPAWDPREAEAALQAAMNASPEWQEAVQAFQHAKREHESEVARYDISRGNNTVSAQMRSRFWRQVEEAAQRLSAAQTRLRTLRSQLIEQVWAARAAQIATGGSSTRKHKKSKHRKSKGKSKGKSRRKAH